ncbi:MAG: ABC transporter permease, partial [Anaerolineae bacterium]|nr:ABC transporter permease [Anaerolineae bacterium]
MISKIIDNLRVAYIGLVSNKLRSALTMLGITIGVAAVVLLVSIGQAVEHFVVDQFSAVGSNLIVVLGDVSSSANSSSAAANPAAFFVPLTEGDVAAISDSFRVPDLRVVAPNLGVVSSASYEGHEIAVQIAGVTGEYFDALHVETAQGRLITDEDQNTAARVVVVDERAADALFGGDYPIGKRIRIGDIAFEVVGVAENFGGMGGDQGTAQVYVPLASAQRYLSSQRTLKGEYTITSIVMEAISDQRVDSAISQVTQVLREEHDLSDDEDNDF